jgi:methylglutaconyl-CoA hydratase
MARELSDVFCTVGQDPSVRGILLTGSGSAFCAGADLAWMSANRGLTEGQARADAEQLLAMYRSIEECPCPVLARVQGPTFGGGVGLVAVCDIVVASEAATFALSEVRFGLVPAIVAPFLVRKTGVSFLRRFALTGEAFPPSTARRNHLVHEVVPSDQLDGRMAELVQAVTGLAPQAIRHTKALLRQLTSPYDAEMLATCIDANVQARLSAEAQEGLHAFLAKRSPAWALGVAEQEQSTR